MKLKLSQNWEKEKHTELVFPVKKLIFNVTVFHMKMWAN